MRHGRRHATTTDRRSRRRGGMPIARGDAALDRRDRPRAADDARACAQRRSMRRPRPARRRCAGDAARSRRRRPSLAQQQADFWSGQHGLVAALRRRRATSRIRCRPRADKDRRFAAPQWRDNPVFDMIRQSYLLVSDHMLEGRRCARRASIRAAARAAALRHARLHRCDEPVQLRATNPQVLEKTIETQAARTCSRGSSICSPTSSKGQLTHTDPNAFEVGRNIAATPGKVIHETPLYQLIQYTPTTEQVLETPLVIFPPWINRFYILDLNPEKSFIRWAVEQGLTVFVVSWKSADASLADVDDGRLCRCAGRSTRSTRCASCSASRRVHAIGYCVAGTDARRDARAARRARRGRQGRERDLLHRAGRFHATPATSTLFIDDEQMKLIEQHRRRQGLSRRALYGGDVQPAARARPDLELCRQQLSDGRGLSAVRPAPLERRHDQPAAQMAPRLSRRPLSRQQAGRAGRDRDRRHADRPDQGRDARLCPGRPRGSYRARRKACGRSPTISAGRCASCSPDRAISPAWSTRRRARNINIGPTTRRSTRSTSSSRARPRPRAAGGPTGSAGSRQLVRTRSPADGARIPGEGKLPAIEDAPGTLRQDRDEACSSRDELRPHSLLHCTIALAIRRARALIVHCNMDRGGE